ncbi:BnaC08g49680D [Brassica napus]|uniref:BnaC08g49680D protein n=1 Tax=Brassica napus TaxID=3708 RepID=A0A078J0F7_BRANA|nr:BnaC08g49680D [Brassica napus]
MDRRDLRKMLIEYRSRLDGFTIPDSHLICIWSVV